MRRVNINILAGLVGFAVLSGCESSESASNPAPIPATTSEPQALIDARLEEVRRELDREFVVFAAPNVVIDRLGTPLAPPVTLGSRPGPGTMASDDPEVVSVEPNGTLVAHRDGTTRVRAAGSTSTLTVVVRTRARGAGSRRATLEVTEGVLP